MTLATPETIKEAGLKEHAAENVATAAGFARLNTFEATVELPVGTYSVIVASSRIPKVLPFQLFLGRNILDQLDFYALGKNKVTCLKDP